VSGVSGCLYGGRDWTRTFNIHGRQLRLSLLLVSVTFLICVAAKSVGRFLLRRKKSHHENQETSAPQNRFLQAMACRA
jgi:hypothetical protein